MFLIWPDNSFERMQADTTKSLINISYKKGLPFFDYTNLRLFYKNTANPVADITKETGLNYLHSENRFSEFDREPLIPHMLSKESPCVAVADINKDGLDDIFIGGSRNSKAAIFTQEASGKLIKMPQPVLDSDSSYENTGAAWADVNNDGNIDLIVASGGNEFYGFDSHNTPRIYINDGKALFIKKQTMCKNMSTS